MKWITLAVLSTIFVGCAHKFHPERSISSLKEEQKREYYREPFGTSR